MPPPIPGASDDLTEAERFMVLAAQRGEVIDLKRNHVRGAVLRDLALEARPGWTLPPAGIRLHKAIVTGGLDLEGAQLDKPLLVWHSRFESGGDKGTIIVRDARLKRLGIHSSTVEGPIIADRAVMENGFFLGGGLVKGALQVRGATIDGALAIEGTEIGDGKQAILAAGLRLKGPMILRRAQLKGEVAFPRAELMAGIYGEDARIVRDGMAMNGESARIAGDVLLDRANLTGGLRLANARIGGQMSAAGLVIAATPEAIAAGGLGIGQSLNLTAARLAGTVSLAGAEIGKMFLAEGAEFWGEETAIVADVMSVGGNWDMARSKVVGVLSCPGVRVGGQLRLTEARLMGRAIAVRADGAVIRGGCYMSRATVLGLLRFPAAEIGNQFRLTGATLKAEAGPALLAAGSMFRRDVELGGGFSSTGALVFDHARVLGGMSLDGGSVKSVALSGLAQRPGAEAGRAAAASDRLDTVALSLVDAEIDRLTMPSRSEDRPLGIVDLSRAHVASYADFAAAWPLPPGLRGRGPGNRDIDHIVLDGFTYEHLSNPSGGDLSTSSSPRRQRIGEARVSWLEGQGEDVLKAHFKPQAWVQLAGSLGREGYHDDARTVHVARRRRESRSRATRALERFQGRLLDVLALYGYNPWRTVLWMGLVVLACAGIFGLAARDCTRTGCFDEAVFTVSNRDAYSADRIAEVYPPFSALAYSFDVFVPFVSFGYEDHWRPNSGWAPLGAIDPGSIAGDSGAISITGGGLLYVLTVIEAILGLILTSLAVTGFTGLLRSDQ